MDKKPKEKYERPKQTSADVADAIVKAGISSIPLVGAPAAELFSLILRPPLEKRRDEWMNSIGEGLRRLETEFEGFKIENLAENDSFVTTVAHATQVAIRNHQKEKLDALRNAVLNAALPNSPEEDLQMMFLNYVDSLTTWHIRVLVLFQNPKEWIQKQGRTPPNLSTGSPSVALESGYPELQGKRELYDIFVRDLHYRGLMSTDSLHTSMSGDGIWSRRTTDLGQRFIEFITSPLREDNQV